MTIDSVSQTANTASAQDTRKNSSTNSATDTKDMFLKLMITQLQNQDPLNPTDSSQFLTQLSQINSVEQLVDIHQDLDQLVSTAVPQATA